MGVVGCTGPGSGYSRIGESPGSLFANMRQSPEEIARLERNVHYYTLMGQPELGLKEMELAHQQNPDNLQITDLLAQNYEELGKFEAARQLYQEALTRHGPHGVLANNLCFSYYRQGLWQKAETCFRQTLDHDPGNVAARNNLGLLYCRLGRQDEAHRLWQEAEGVAAADAKMSQALAVLGMPASAVYARKPEPIPPATRATQAPTPKAAASRLPAAIPAKPNTPAQPVTPKVSAVHLATKPKAPTPAPVAAKPPAEARKQAVVTQKALAAQAPTPAPVAAKPRPEARKQAVVAQKALAAQAPAPAPQAASRTPHPPLTTAELVNTAIEVRNGSHTKNLAHQTRSLLQRDGFTVARIGDQRYSDAAKTTIYYRPGAERAAWAVCRAVFPEAKLAPSKKLKKGMDILVLLRRDLLENPQFMAHLNDGGPPAAPLSQPPTDTDTFVAAKTEAGQQPLAAQPLTSPAPTPLTVAELVDTAIEVRNGTWTRHLARQTRSLLCQQGFTVAKIGNHVDFGATKTIIYYRPGAERVARAVGATVFPPAGLEPSLKLKKGMDIKILLGADLLQRPLLMARLFAGDI
ncbi:MAG: LytR C-terminal domain-containing protein [Proteobacteria bacterium]|nr:LytR C-terminal domain-containing protein [Pseudomonadota bacterium]